MTLRRGSGGIGSRRVSRVRDSTQHPLMGLSGFTDANHYETANGEGLRGSTSMTVAALCLQDSLTAAVVVIASTRDPDGWQLQRHTAQGGYRFAIDNGAGTFVSSPVRSQTASENGKWFVLHGTYDGTTVRLYFNGAEVGSGTATSGYTASAGTVRMRVGGLSIDGFAATGITIGGISGSDSVVLTGPQVLAHFNAIKNKREMVSITSAEQTNDVFRQAQAVPSEWVADVGDNLDLSGSLSLTVDSSPVFV